jgi:ATP-dependent DNA helicase HFM1/MER3
MLHQYPSITKLILQTTRVGEHVLVRVRADIGFMNEKTPEYFQKKAVYVCLIAELSDGHLLHFARIRCVPSLGYDEHAANNY